MSKIIIEGGRRLYGKTYISRAKNACLPIIAASVATCGKVFLHGAPEIKDVCVMAEIIQDLGGDYRFCENGLELKTDTINSYIGNENIYKNARASLFTAGGLLARFGRAYVPYPGGCSIGKRPIDIHIAAFESLNVKAHCMENGVYFDGTHMRAGKVVLRYPSVGATVNAVCAALCLNGETEICGCACEPEISDMCRFLNKCGYNVVFGKGRIVINGGRLSVKNVEYMPICDRIEAGTYLFACLACGGEIAFDYDCPSPLLSVFDVIRRCGAKVYFNNGSVYMRSDMPPLPINITADVFPAFPSDLQPQLCAALAVCSGESIVSDKVFSERFCYADELEKFGAATFGRYGEMKITGVKNLHAARVKAKDLRGGAALCIAALNADGVSEIDGADMISRGYYDLCGKINALGGCACTGQ